MQIAIPVAVPIAAPAAAPLPFCVFITNYVGLDPEPELLREVNGFDEAWDVIRADCAAANTYCPEENPRLEDFKEYPDYETWRAEPDRPTYARFTQSDIERGIYFTLAMGDHFEYAVYAGTVDEYISTH